MKKKTAKNSSKYLILFLIVPAAFFIGIPIILNIPYIKCLSSLFLESLGITEYKVAYIEFIGAILGTYLAILGAIWVQKREKNEQQKEETIKTATIVYYDIKLACLDLINMIKWDKSALSGDIYLVRDWIERVSNLPADKIDIQMVYRIYGDFNNAKLKLNQSRDGNSFLQLIEQDEIKTILTREYLMDIQSSTTTLLYSNSPDDYSLIKRYIKCDINEILAKLREIANIVEIQKEEQPQEAQEEKSPELPLKLECLLRELAESFKLYNVAKSNYLTQTGETQKQLNEENLLEIQGKVLATQKELFSILYQSSNSTREREAIKAMLEKALEKYTNTPK